MFYLYTTLRPKRLSRLRVYPVSGSIPGRDLVQRACNRNNANSKLLIKGAAFAAFASRVLWPIKFQKLTNRFGFIMEIEFVDITEPDLIIVKEIYDYYIEKSTSTYYTEKITINELKEFILIGNEKYKSYLIKDRNECCGFCYLSQYKKRQAYDRTAEISLYLKPDYTGKGIGNKVLKFLNDVAKRKGIAVLLAIISGDNESSIRLFEKNEYEKCGHLKQIGEKFNNILDVVFYQKIL
jgi:L-amino acid N-acyltransferase YncA